MEIDENLKEANYVSLTIEHEEAIAHLKECFKSLVPPFKSGKLVSQVGSQPKC